MREFTNALTTVVGDHGLYAVFLLMLADAVLPAASEVVMLYAGAVAVGAFPGQEVTLFGATFESTAWGYVAMAGAGAIGYTAGSVLGWAIGLYGGRPYLERHGRWLDVTPAKLDRAEAWFERYGDWAVLVGRVVPVVRSFVSIPAGFAEMPLPRFVVLTFLGNLPWCFAFASGGLAVGSGWERFHERWRYADYAVAALIVVAVLLLVLRTVRRRARRRAASGARAS